MDGTDATLLQSCRPFAIRGMCELRDVAHIIRYMRRALSLPTPSASTVPILLALRLFICDIVGMICWLVPMKKFFRLDIYTSAPDTLLGLRRHNVTRSRSTPGHAWDSVAAKWPLPLRDKCISRSKDPCNATVAAFIRSFWRQDTSP